MKMVHGLVAALLCLGCVSVRAQTDAIPTCIPLGDVTGAPGGTGPTREPRGGGQGQGGGDQADPAPSTTPMRARSNAVTSTLPICPNGTGNPPTGRKWKGRSSGSKAGLSAPALFTVALTVLRML
ncbi:uncharacterized protein LOC118424094 [Branchiostoma floridae]|uniref:Uncharacterized protein LOC118424094 n=1 Tax=Branchiostoma floridae TaxID=7739 RepID=A0A9J7LU09_BRAFL|nr:uncharacterized protein LOC118424094 [Branchiostoma floridae]